jgi:hypothetical protein
MLNVNFLSFFLQIIIHIFLNLFNLAILLKFESEEFSSDVCVQVNVDTKILLNPLV